MANKTIRNRMKKGSRQEVVTSNERDLGRILQYLYKRRGRRVDIQEIERILPLKAERLSIESRLREENLISDSREWRLTPKGNIYTEFFSNFKHDYMHVVGCTALCVLLITAILSRLLI